MLPLLSKFRGVTLQCIATFTAALSAIGCGMHDAWPSASLPHMLDQNSSIPTTSAEGSWIAVMPLLGGIIGAVIAIYTIDKIGRKQTILITIVTSLSAWIVIASVNSVKLIMVARFVAGMSGGVIFSTLPIYTAEISDPKIRGFLGSSLIIGWTIGALLINSIGPFVSISTAALISCTIPILLLATFSWMPESAYFHVLRGNLEDAQKSLVAFTGKDNVDTELADLKNSVKEQTENSGKFLDLFTCKSNRKALLITMFLRGFQQFSGATPIFFYITTIFQKSENYMPAHISTIIFYSAYVVLCMLLSLSIDKLGRKPILIISSIGCTITLLVQGTFFYLQSLDRFETNDASYITLICLFVFVIFNTGLQILPVPISAELFPVNVKAFAMCVLDVYFNLAGTTAAKLFQILKDEYGIYSPFYMFAASTALAVIFSVLFVPETKRKTLQEIQDKLKNAH